MANNKIDYSGRTVDLLLLKTVMAVPVVNKRVGIDVSDDPMIVTGVEKMVQRFAIAFINAIGSTKFMPDHGTNLVPRVAAGMVYDMATLEMEAASANMLAIGQIISADEDEETPDDERLVSSEITGLEYLRGEERVKISVRLTTAAGKSYVYIIPVGVGVH